MKTEVAVAQDQNIAEAFLARIQGQKPNRDANSKRRYERNLSDDSGVAPGPQKGTRKPRKT